MTSTPSRTSARRQVLVSGLLAIGLTVGWTGLAAGSATAAPNPPAVGASSPAAGLPPDTGSVAQPVTAAPAIPAVTAGPEAATGASPALAAFRSSLSSFLGLLQRLVAQLSNLTTGLRVWAASPDDACAATTATTCDYGLIRWVPTRFANHEENLATPADVDWLRFTASFSGPWDVTLAPISPSALAGSLMDGKGREIASGRVSTDGSVALSASLQAGTTYYVVARDATPTAAATGSMLRYAVTFSSPGIRVGDTRLWIGVTRDPVDLAGAADRTGYEVEGDLEQEFGPYLPDRTVQLMLASDGHAQPVVRDFTTGVLIPATGCPVPASLRSSAWWAQPSRGLPGVPQAPTLSCYAITTDADSHFGVTVTSAAPGVVAVAGWFDPVAGGLGAQWYLAVDSELSMAFTGTPSTALATA